MATPLPPKARQRVCLNQRRIQEGLLTVEDAWGTMPVKFIENIKMVEAKRMHNMRREAKSKAEAELDNPNI